ncbi:MAG: M28 family metallopeptidase [Thermonemataceae bacterium]
MRVFVVVFICCVFQTVLFGQPIPVEKSKQAAKFATTITAEELKEHLYTLAADSMEGRMSGEAGQKKAARYIASQFEAMGLQKGMDTSYFQVFEIARVKRRYRLVKPNMSLDSTYGIKTTENVVGYIEGTSKKEEVLVISAHYDHVGKKYTTIFNGADDNASGTSGMIEIAEAFAEAQKAGYRPKRTIVFLLVSAEEIGLMGSSFYTNYQPLFPLENTVANLNVDMIGRVDENHQENPDYIYLIGSDKLSEDLHQLSERVNATYMQLKLDYTYNADNDPNRYYYRSDHYNFAKNNIPVIFYFNGVHADYHQPTDTPDKINYTKMTKIAQLVFFTAWEIANREARIQLNEESDK